MRICSSGLCIYVTMIITSCKVELQKGLRYGRMSSLVEWMKDAYLIARNGALNWKPLYSNNMPSNGQDGIYTDMNLRSDNGYQYIKFSIQYQSRCDAEGIIHPEEGTKYYVFHSLVIDELEEMIQIPEPNNDFAPFTDDNDNLIVNIYGRFRYAFDDEETAKSVACYELLHLIYPYSYILSEDEGREWNRFLTDYADNVEGT